MRSSLNAWALGLLLLMPACGEEELEIASCANPESQALDNGVAEADASSDAVESPWSTGFETGYCGYVRPEAFCYVRGSSSHALVTTPVHAGRYAMSLTVNGDPSELGTQARCLRQGVFPESAYYGAWFFIPPTLVDGEWNLMHFSGDDAPSEDGHGLWDVSLVQAEDSSLQLRVRNFLSRSNSLPKLTGASPVLFNTWVHLVFFLKRAAEATGEVKLYQDGREILHLTDLVTDDAPWGQWLVGSYAAENTLYPRPSTLYLDDVTLSEEP